MSFHWYIAETRLWYSSASGRLSALISWMDRRSSSTRASNNAGNMRNALRQIRSLECVSHRLILSQSSLMPDNGWNIHLTRGSASSIMSSGNTSGTPPTLVLTTSSLSQRNYMCSSSNNRNWFKIPATCCFNNCNAKSLCEWCVQKDIPFHENLSEWPCTRLVNRRSNIILLTSRTSAWSTAPKNVTRSCNWCFSLTSSRTIRLGPSPPDNIIPGKHKLLYTAMWWKCWPIKKSTLS